VTVLLGAAMRFYELGALPPGLYHDEAFNGLDALRVLGGDRPIFFEANNGREPFFLYGMALALSWLGRTPFAVRLPAAVLGTLTVPATFLVARALFDRRVGLWSAVLVAVAPWPINLSRIGLRAVSMPLVVALALWFWWSGRRPGASRRVVRWVGGGALLGLSLYTYTAARFVLLAVILFVLYQTWVSHKSFGRCELYCLLGATILVMVPLIVYGVAHWETFVLRSAQVSILNPEISHGDPFGMLARNVVRAAGLFVVRGDWIPRHNVPLRPLFDPLTSVFFVLGVLLSLAKARKGGPHALVLLWTGVMLLPTILAEDCPHFLRAVGVLPVAAVFPALGLSGAGQWLGRRFQPWVSQATIGGVLAVSAAWGGYDYFVRHADNPDLAYWFEANQVQEAVEINRFLGSGWQGYGVREPPSVPIPGRQVYLAPRMWEDRLAVNFLVPSTERLSILGRDAGGQRDEVLILAWPYEDMGLVQQTLPHPARIEVWPGPLEQGDLDTEPRLLYVAFRAVHPGEPTEAIARFEGGIELVGWQVDPQDKDRTHLRLQWRTDRCLSTDYTVFVHLLREAQVVAQDDGAPGGGFYPTRWWVPGDEIVDVHILDAPYDPGREQLVIGWYEFGSMEHLRVIEENGQSGADRLALQ
jgi:4-amino-4-deoxy-L-arabinose transferase-like glycosyltransferase